MVKEKRVRLPNGTMDCAIFGSGTTPLIILPGLGDGLKGVRGTALPMAFMYRTLGKHFRVYMCSRKKPLPPVCTTRSLAEDQLAAMQALGLTRAHVLGVSQGGMIAQWMAIDHPEAVDRLVLTATASCPNDTLTRCVSDWMRFARKGDHLWLMKDNLHKIYTAEYVKRSEWMIPFVGYLTKPKSYDRFLSLADACLTHDCSEHLGRISAPTLIIGGGDDRVLTGESSSQLAREIPGSRLRLYPGLGHGVYEEAKDFQRVVCDFLLEQ